MQTLTANTRRTFSRDYPEALYSYLRTGGLKVGAALYEGSGSAGGFAVPVRVAGDFVQLAPQDSAIRRIATVIATTDKIKFPIKASGGTAAEKPESGASTYLFTDSSPTLGAFFLDGYVAGVASTVSMELFQDVAGLETFLSQDAALDLETLEEGKFLTGSGIQEPQGMLGNVGAGVTAATADSNGNLLSVNATFDVLDTLKDVYHAGASWLMSRSTGTALRKAQNASEQNIFNRVGGQDYLHGYPVAYSAAMPAIAPGSTPVLFGNFALGYLIGDRGGPGVFVKTVDQTLALEAQVQLLIWRKTDGRVRRSEAIQAITLHT